MRFPLSDSNLWYKKETQVNGCSLGEHSFDEEIILNKNKNKNKITICAAYEKTAEVARSEFYTSSRVRFPLKALQIVT